MAIDSKPKSPEREDTDESLRAEREKTDQAIAGALVDRKAGVNEDADMMVQRARYEADLLTTAARDRTDQQMDEAPSHSAITTIAEERVQADESLRDARAAGDEALRNEREESVAALSRLLPMERDKTDRYLLTERARSDDALANRDDFLGIVSHDLRNLLAGIVMSAAQLTGSASDTEEGKQMLAGTQRIQRYAARMNRLIGDLVDVASIDAGKLAATAVLGDCAALVVEAVDTFQATASAQGISLEVELVGPPLVGHFDRERMLQVLANLISNAIKFTARGGRIVIRCERSDDELLVSVRDTGAGIPGNLLEAIFERFWQVGKNDRRGVGLGLYISKGIVEAHGGRIWAESKLGQGTRIFFAFPITGPPEGGSQTPAALLSQLPPGA